MSPKALLVASALVASTALTATAASAASNDGKRPAPIGAAIMFNMLDQNGDGSVDATELQALTSAIIAAVDTDDDGALSESELNQIVRGFGQRGGPGKYAARGPRGGQHGQYQRGPRGQQHGQFQRGPGGPGGDREDRQARAAERFGIDEDGLTQQEFLDRQLERFSAADADADGTVTLEEFLMAAREFRGPPRIR